MLLGSRTIALCLLAYIPLVFIQICTTEPYYGSQIFLGHGYWNTRYSLNFPNDWPGFWNNYIDGRKKYERQSTELITQCSGCSCDDLTQELTCSGTPTSLV